MERTIRFASALSLLCMSCAVPLRPETSGILENIEATQRLDAVKVAHGTAMVLTEDGYLLTTCHVAKSGKTVINISEDGGPAVRYPARLVACDAKRDLAVIKIERRFSMTVVLGDLDEVSVLDGVYIVGFPYDFGEIAVKGYVAAIGYDHRRRHIRNGLVVELEAVPGDSGGGVFLTRNGKLVGMLVMLSYAGPESLPSAQFVIRVAVPVDEIKTFLDAHHIPYRTSFPEPP